MKRSFRLAGVVTIAVLSAGCSLMSTKNTDMARLEREVEDLQDQVYGLQKTAQDLTETVEALANGRTAKTPQYESDTWQMSSPAKRQEPRADEKISVRLLEPVPEPRPVSEQRPVMDPSPPVPRETIKEEPLSGTRPEPKEETPDPPSVTERAAKDAPDPLYTKGLKALTLEDYDTAIMNFEKYMEKEPDSSLSDNAQFFIADAYYRAENYPQAIVEYNRVIDLYPRGDAVPEALYKIGLSYGELNDRRNAAHYFNKVIDQYPVSSAAFSAKRSLKEIN